MAKELYYFENKNSDEEELIQSIEGWLIDGYDHITIRGLMWVYRDNIAFLADGIEVSWDYEVDDYTLRKSDFLSVYHFSVDDLKAHDALMETKDQYAFEDYIRNNTHDGDLLKLINLSEYDKYYIITA